MIMQNWVMKHLELRGGEGLYLPTQTYMGLFLVVPTHSFSVPISLLRGGKNITSE